MARAGDAKKKACKNRIFASPAPGEAGRQAG